MRGHDEQTAHMFSYLSPEQRVPADHPLRAVRALTDEALQTMSRRFASLYATTGRPSIPPEQLLRALLLQVLYTVRSERLLMEALNDNLLFRWFVGLNMDDPVWHPTTFTKNRDRLLSGDVAAAFFDAVQAHARAAGLLSDEHFTVDGTQLEAWASLALTGDREWRLAVLVGRVDFGPGREQQVHHGSVAAVRRPQQRRGPIGMTRVHVHAVGDKRTDRRLVATLGRIDQTRILGSGTDRDRRDQQRHQRQLHPLHVQDGPFRVTVPRAARAFLHRP